LRLQKQAELKKTKGIRIFEELLQQRDSKMRRFCNYFVTLFNQKKINPLSQFVNMTKLKEIKQMVRNKMDFYTSEDPDKIKQLEEIERNERSNKVEADRKARIA
jgi:hypothetical protein